jgi:hypothetical protein
MRNVPDEIRLILTDDELSEIAAHPIALADGTESHAIDLAVAWNLHVRKIDQDRALPWSDRSVWTEHDLAGALFLRDRVERSLNKLPPTLAAKLRTYVDAADTRFRSFTVDDSGERLGKIASVDFAGRGWWWFRVPNAGPISQDLARYSH